MTRVTINLAVRSETMRPEQITAALQLKPDRSVLRGADREPPRILPRRYGWFLSSIDYDIDIGKALSAILTRASTIPQHLNSLRSIDPNVEIGLAVSIAPKDTNIPLLFGQATIAKLCELTASLDIEFFDFVSEEDAR